MLMGQPESSHPAIDRHLTRLRDAAHAVMGLFDLHHHHPHQDQGAEAGTQAEPRPAQPPHKPTPHVKSPLEARIDRHMAVIDRALTLVSELNPDGKRRQDLADEAQREVGRQEHNIRDVIDAEVHFWAATIEHNPATRLDETEVAWVRRIVRLGNIVGCSPDREESLTFLRSWGSNIHH
jgi:hypothetical protein